MKSRGVVEGPEDLAERASLDAYGESQPRATPEPSLLDVEVRCTGPWRGGRCGKLLAEFATRPWRITCPRCKHVNDMTAKAS
jgi:phage FluMu protein Com